MLDDFRLRVFMMVATESSFTRAAQHLGVSQPAVSQNIAELEKQVGAALFERKRGEVALTAEGYVFKVSDTDGRVVRKRGHRLLGGLLLVLCEGHSGRQHKRCKDCKDAFHITKLENHY